MRSIRNAERISRDCIFSEQDIMAWNTARSSNSFLGGSVTNATNTSADMHFHCRIALMRCLSCSVSWCSMQHSDTKGLPVQRVHSKLSCSNCGAMMLLCCGSLKRKCSARYENCKGARSAFANRCTEMAKRPQVCCKCLLLFCFAIYGMLRVMPLQAAQTRIVCLGVCQDYTT